MAIEKVNLGKWQSIKLLGKITETYPVTDLNPLLYIKALICILLGRINQVESYKYNCVTAATWNDRVRYEVYEDPEFPHPAGMDWDEMMITKGLRNWHVFAFTNGY